MGKKKAKSDYVPYKEEIRLIKLGIGNSGPTLWQQAFWFLRKKFNLPSHIQTHWQPDWNDYSYQYHFLENKAEWNCIEHYKTYQEAELACLQALLKIAEELKN